MDPSPCQNVFEVHPFTATSGTASRLDAVLQAVQHAPADGRAAAGAEVCRRLVQSDAHQKCWVKRGRGDLNTCLNMPKTRCLLEENGNGPSDSKWEDPLVLSGYPFPSLVFFSVGFVRYACPFLGNMMSLVPMR